MTPGGPGRVARCARAALAGLVLACLGAWAGLGLLPMPEGVRTADRSATIVLTDRNGRPLREAWMDERGASRWASLDDISPHLKAATLVAEDRRFFDHRGVDVRAVARAAWQNLVAREVRSGASTITQQVVACTDSRAAGWKSKIVQTVQALRVERELPKERILELYLNVVPYGNNTRGAQSASLYYFGRPASQLSLAQAALLAGLPRGPTHYDPLRHLDRARERQHWILDEMRRTGAITAEAHARATEEPLQVGAHAEAFLAPHFADLVQSRVRSLGVVRVRTTLDQALQADVECIVRQRLRDIEGRGATSGAVVVLDNDTGDVRAMLGSPDFFDAGNDGQVNGALALRQPGSTLKPFTYGLALERGGTPADLIDDLPVRYATPTGEYAPRNYDGLFHGRVRMRTALACSYNVPAVRTLHDLGAGGCDLLLARLHQAGFASLDRPAAHYGLGLTLGGGEVSLLELTRAYRALARGGRYSPERAWTAAWDAAGREVRVPAADADRETPVFAPPVAFLLTDILADPAARAPAFGLDSPLALPFPCAVKTGTSQEFCDNWTVGFTPGYTVGVWVGGTRGRPMEGVAGVTGAGPIFRDVMLRLHREGPPVAFPRPPGLRRLAVCPETGRLVGTGCPSSVLEWFEAGRAPREACAGGIASHDRPGPDPRVGGIAPADRARTGAEGCRTAMAVRNPQEGDVFIIDPVLPRRLQVLVLEAEVPDGMTEVTWEVDGRIVERVGRPYSARWTLAPGRHVARIVLPSGAGAAVSFSVR